MLGAGKFGSRGFTRRAGANARNRGSHVRRIDSKRYFASNKTHAAARTWPAQGTVERPGPSLIATSLRLTESRSGTAAVSQTSRSNVACTRDCGTSSPVRSSQSRCDSQSRAPGPRLCRRPAAATWPAPGTVERPGPSIMATLLRLASSTVALRGRVALRGYRAFFIMGTDWARSR
jgi:hypothetical protein